MAPAQGLTNQSKHPYPCRFSPTPRIGMWTLCFMILLASPSCCGDAELGRVAAACIYRCGPCKVMYPLLVEMATEQPDVVSRVTDQYCCYSNALMM